MPDGTLFDSSTNVQPSKKDLKREYDRKRRESRPGENAAKCAAYYAANREKLLVQQREYLKRPEVVARQKKRNREVYLANRDERIAKQRAYQKTERGKQVQREAIVRMKEKFPDRVKARTAVGNAVRDGRLQRANVCQRCNGTGPVEAHHHKGYDPEHWLDVQWLCIPCHKQADQEQGL